MKRRSIVLVLLLAVVAVLAISGTAIAESGWGWLPHVDPTMIKGEVSSADWGDLTFSWSQKTSTGQFVWAGPSGTVKGTLSYYGSAYEGDDVIGVYLTGSGRDKAGNSFDAFVGLHVAKASLPQGEQNAIKILKPDPSVTVQMLPVMWETEPPIDSAEFTGETVLKGSFWWEVYP